MPNFSAIWRVEMNSTSASRWISKSRGVGGSMQAAFIGDLLVREGRIENAECRIQKAEGGNSPGVYKRVWTSLVHLVQAEKRILEIVRLAGSRGGASGKCVPRRSLGTRGGRAFPGGARERGSGRRRSPEI